MISTLSSGVINVNNYVYCCLPEHKLIALQLVILQSEKVLRVYCGHIKDLKYCQ